MKKTSKTPKQVLRDRTRLEWVLLAALLLIAFLLLASRYQWWPWSSSDQNLGTAFLIVKEKDINNKAASPLSQTGNGSGSGSSNSGNGGGSGSGGSGSSGGSSSSDSALLNLAAQVNKGDTKAQISDKATGLDQNCGLVVTTSSAGKEQVCTYTKGNKIITVTYLNNHVVSASKSGF